MGDFFITTFKDDLNQRHSLVIEQLREKPSGKEYFHCLIDDCADLNIYLNRDGVWVDKAHGVTNWSEMLGDIIEEKIK
jgi:hypothetical protein